MKKYHKIQSIFKRDEQTHKFIVGKYSEPEFAYLKSNKWVFTEKIDGTNIRIYWDNLTENLAFGGRTDNAQVPTKLYSRLGEIFTAEKFSYLYPGISMTLYGEGYGAKIQKGGGNYIPSAVDFILFDVLIGDWWLKREDVEKIANNLDIKVVPIVDEGTLFDAINSIIAGLKSQWGDFLAEGIVLRPKVELKDRAGRRVITKLKHKDFE